MYHFSNRTIQGQALININGKNTAFTQKKNILGVTFDQKLSMKDHIDEKINMATCTLTRLHRFKTMKTNLQFMIYKTLCLFQLLFSITAFIYPKIYGIDKLQKFQNKAIRQIHSI